MLGSKIYSSWQTPHPIKTFESFVIITHHFRMYKILVTALVDTVVIIYYNGGIYYSCKSK